jgi:hypothetical protein
VWNEPRHNFTELQQAWPLNYGDRVRVEATAPANLFVTLFHYSEGQWQALASMDAVNELEYQRLEYPSKSADRAVEIIGVPGLDLLVLLGNRHRLPTVEDLPQFAELLPDIPAENIIQLDAENCMILTISGKEHTKGFSSAVAIGNPSAVVEQRLMQWRSELPADCEFLKALGYHHGE